MLLPLVVIKKQCFRSTDLFAYLKQMAAGIASDNAHRYRKLKSNALKVALVRDYPTVQYYTSPNPSESEHVCTAGISFHTVSTLTLPDVDTSSEDDSIDIQLLGHSSSDSELFHSGLTLRKAMDNTPGISINSRHSVSRLFQIQDLLLHEIKDPL